MTNNEDLWSDEICALVDAAFETVSRNPSDHEEVVAYRRAIAAAMRQPKALTVTVVSAYDGSPMHTFKIDPTKKTIVRPLHSLLGYVFEPEGSHADD